MKYPSKFQPFAWLTLLIVASLTALTARTQVIAPQNPDQPDPPRQELSKEITPQVNKIMPLHAESTDEFLRTVTNSSLGQLSSVRAELQRVSENPVIVDALANRLLILPVTDIDRHLTILSALGEMRNPRAITALKNFIWAKQAVVSQPLAGHSTELGVSFFNHDGALRARAVEMLAYINNEESSAEVLHIAADHPGAEVRLAAMDSYLYDHGDSDQAKAELARTVRPDEIKLIGLPRFTKSTNPKLFDQQVAAFYKRYPEELPPSPDGVAAIPPTGSVVPRRDRPAK